MRFWRWLRSDKPGQLHERGQCSFREGSKAMRYATPDALDAAIIDRIRNVVEASPYGVTELRRQFAYDRILVRIFLADPDGWILKGGTGLLARMPFAARHSLDVDLYRQTSIDAAVRDLTTAGDMELGDFFTFDVEKDVELTGIHPGVRCRIVAYLGDREFARFPIDVVVRANMTGQPTVTDPLTPFEIEGLPTTPYHLYPIADHIADKHAAMIDTYGDGAPSSRYRDLVDLVLIATTQSVNAHDLRRALVSEYAYRNLETPTTVTLPSPDWIAGYAAVARSVPTLDIVDANAAVDIVRKLIDPALDGTARGTWDPHKVRWTSL